MLLSQFLDGTLNLRQRGQQGRHDGAEAGRHGLIQPGLAGRHLIPVVFLEQHALQIAATIHERIQPRDCFRHRFPQRQWLVFPGFCGKTGQHLRIQRIGLGALPFAFHPVMHLLGVDQHHFPPARMRPVD